MKRLLIIVFLGFAIGVNAQQVNWYTIEEAFELNKTKPRKIMVDVYTSWCGWCKVMDKNTFSHPVIADYLNNNYYAVKFNAEQKEEINLNGTAYKFVESGRSGYHELAAALLNGKLSYPSVVFLDENNQIIHLQQGFTKAQPFDKILKFIGDNSYKSISWEKWLAAYKSPISSE